VAIISPTVDKQDHCTLANVSSPEIPAHYAENECFLPAFPSLLLSPTACDVRAEQDHRRGLSSRSTFSLPMVVQLS